MKFSFLNDIQAYVITDRGRLIDSDLDPHALRARHQFCEVDEDADAVKRMLGEDEAVRRIRAIFDEPDTAIATNADDDDLALINDFLLFNDDYDTPTNY